VVFDEVVYSTAAGATTEALAKVVEIFCGASGDNFDVTIFGVADPATQVEFAGFAVNEPAEAYALYATFDEEVEDHVDQGSVFQRVAVRRNMASVVIGLADMSRA
jgi:hypothetical protein